MQIHVDSLYYVLALRPKKIIELFLRPLFGEPDVAGWVLFLFRQKTNAGTFFFQN